MAAWQDIIDQAADFIPKSLEQGGPVRSGELTQIHPKEAHPYYEVCIGVEGQSAVTGPGTYVPLSTGQSCIVYPDALHWESAISGQPAFANIWLVFEESIKVLRTKYNLALDRFGSISAAELCLSDAMHRVLSDLETAMMNTADRLIVKGLWLELLGRVRETPAVAGKPGRAHIARQVRFTIAKMQAEPGRWWQIRELAEMIGWSPNHYSMRFRQIVGRSPLDYLIHHRLERASQLLSSTNMRISEAAYQVGFTSMSYFARRFRRMYGLTPKAFREEHKDRSTEANPC